MKFTVRQAVQTVSGFQQFLILELPGIIEEADVKANILAYSYGPGYKNVICIIIPSKQEIKLP
ncbi:MAG: hypothetical protein WCK34_16770 [Bacteroidota bacterium]